MLLLPEKNRKTMCEGVLFASDPAILCRLHACVDWAFVFELVPVGEEQTKCNFLQSPVYLICAFSRSWTASCHFDSHNSCPVFKYETCDISQTHNGLDQKIWFSVQNQFHVLDKSHTRYQTGASLMSGPRWSHPECFDSWRVSVEDI